MQKNDFLIIKREKIDKFTYIYQVYKMIYYFDREGEPVIRVEKITECYKPEYQLLTKSISSTILEIVQEAEKIILNNNKGGDMNEN